MIIDENIYYVYAYLDPRKPGKYVYGTYEFDYEPFYIGKGKGNRYMEHMRSYEINHGGNIHKSNIIKKILRNDLSPIILKVEENIDEISSIEIEKKLISLVGRRDINNGCLVNHTDGGDGISGYKFTKEYKKTRNKVVIKYDKVGNILNRYDSIELASLDNGVSNNSIIRCCNGDVKFSKNEFIYLYDNIIFNQRTKLDGNKYPVYRIDMNGVVKKYESSEEASINSGLSRGNINSACKGHRFQAGGFLWRYQNHPKIKIYDSQINDKWHNLLSLLDKKIIDINGKSYNNILECISDKKFRTNGVIRYLKKINLI